MTAAEIIWGVLGVIFLLVRVTIGGVLGGLIAGDIGGLLLLHIYKGEKTEFPDDDIFVRVAPFPVSIFVIYSASIVAEFPGIDVFSWGMLCGTVFAGGIAVAATSTIIEKRGFLQEFQPLLYIIVGVVVLFIMQGFGTTWWVSLLLLAIFWVCTQYMLGNFDLGEAIDRIPSNRRRFNAQLRIGQRIFSEYFSIQ